MSLILAVATFLSMISFAGAAGAQIPPVQWQMIGLATTDPAFEDVTGEVQVNLALYGVGLALGAGGEALLLDDDWRGGGFVDLALQLRPMMLAAAVREPRRPVYHYFDPHLDVGGLVGGVDTAEGASFRGIFYVGVGFDVAIPTAWYAMQSQVLLTFGYRVAPSRTQGDGAVMHQLVLGLGFRSGF